MSFSEGGWVLKEVCEEAGGCDGVDDEGDNLIDIKPNRANCEFST
jgi:hypothetical protein